MDPLLIVILSIVGLAVVLPAAFIAVIYGVMPAARFCGWMGRHVGAFLKAMVTDTGRAIGHVVMCFAFSGLVVYNLLRKREKATEHFAMAFEREAMSAGVCMYRLVLGNPLRLLYLYGLIEGLERRLPQVVAQAPADEGGEISREGASQAAGAAEGSEESTGGGSEAARGATERRDGGAEGEAPRGEATQAAAVPRRKHTPKYEGYEILGTLAGGGSGGRLYVARPTPEIEAQLAGGRSEAAKIGDVVIKSFSIREGSSLPQIIRESRSLEAAHRLGLILDHDLTSERFYYVMRYVPGDCLSVVVQDLHAGGGEGGVTGVQANAGAGSGSGGVAGAGLDAAGLRRAIEHTADLVATLRDYHDAGLWHKDIKPDNIIIHQEDGRARLVDFGLLTPLRSSMTLTTHGTEYFRDPEMVRLALRGVKVRDVDGCRFDIYGAGAVLYSLLENSFPAHGALSSIGKRCPDAIKWIVRRAMTDYDKRYPTATAMLDDLLAVIDAMDAGGVGGGGGLDGLRPMDLPSVRSAGFADAYADWVDGGKVGPEPVALEHPSARARTWAAPVPLAGTFTGRRSDRRPAAPADPEAVARNADGQIDLLLAQAADRRAAAQGQGLGEAVGVEEFVPTGEITGVAAGAAAGAEGTERAGAPASSDGGGQGAGGKTGEVTTAEAGEATTGAAQPEDDFEVTMRATEEVSMPRRRHSAGAGSGSSSSSGLGAGDAASVGAGSGRVRGGRLRPAELRPGDAAATSAKKQWSSRVRFSVITFVLLTLVVARIFSGSSGSGSSSGKSTAKRENGAEPATGLEPNTAELAGAGPALTTPGKPVKPPVRGGRKPAEEAPVGGQAAGLGINIDDLSIDLYNLPATLLKAAVSVVTAAPTEEDATAIRSFLKKGPVAVSLAQLNVKSRLLILTDPEVHDSGAMASTLELIDLALWSASIGPIKQNLGQDAIMPNLEGTLAAVSDARFGNKDDAIRVREAMKELPGSPFCSGFLWLTKDAKEAGKLRAWLVLQPDTNPTVAVKIIQSLRVVLRGDLSKK